MNEKHVYRVLVILNIILLIIILYDFESYYGKQREGIAFTLSAIFGAIGAALTKAFLLVQGSYMMLATSNLVLYAILPTTPGMIAFEIAMEVIPLMIETAVGKKQQKAARIAQLTGGKGKDAIPYVLVEKTKAQYDWEDPYAMKRKILIKNILAYPENSETEDNLKKKKTKHLRPIWIEILMKKDPHSRVPHGTRYIEVPSFKCSNPNLTRDKCNTFQCDLQKNKKTKKLQVPEKIQQDWKKINNNTMQTTPSAKTDSIMYKYARLSQCYGATYDATKDPLSKKYIKSTTSTDKRSNVRKVIDANMKGVTNEINYMKKRVDAQNSKLNL
jgi:hypothetical protein